MKKLILLIIFLFYSSNLLAKTQFNLFGMELLDSVKTYLPKSEINEKTKNSETYRGYFDIYSESINYSQLDYFWITVDDENRIHQIYGEKVLNSSINNCIDKVAPTFVNILEEKFDIFMEYGEYGYVDFNIYEFSSFDDDLNKLRVQCWENSSKTEVVVQIFLESYEIFESKVDFYEGGL